MDEQISYLVLHTRLAMLRNSLAMVSNAIDELERVRHPVGATPSEESVVQKLSRAVGDAEDNLRRIVREIPADSQKQATEILNTLEKARMEAVGAARIPHRPLFALDNTTLRVDLGGYATDLLGDLEEIEGKVDAVAGKPDTEAALLMAETWRCYQEALAKSHELFIEYLDLLRGVLLRDAGLDQDLCRIADSLITTWPFAGTAWSSLSIPAEYERPSTSNAQLIRLGFPEWSIWSLPLVAREWGRVFAMKRERVDADVRQAIEKEVGKEAELRSWAADVFATCVAGTAYPWAAIVLRADPGAALDQARVSVMFYTMELLGAPDSYYQPLTRAWQGAVASQFELSTEQKAFIQRIKSRVGIDFRRWEQANDLADKLKRGDKPEEIANTLTIKDLRKVLVAAWQTRIRLAQEFVNDSPPGESAERRGDRRRAYAEKVKKVAENARAICIAIIDRIGPGTGTGFAQAGGPLVSSPGSGPELGPSKSPADYRVGP